MSPVPCCSVRWVICRILLAASPGLPETRPAAQIAFPFCAIKRYTLPRNRKAPSTPCSLQSRSFSGGAGKREKSRAVSAPYRSTSVDGSTTLRLDFDIFGIAPPVLGALQRRHAHHPL